MTLLEKMAARLRAGEYEIDDTDEERTSYSLARDGLAVRLDLMMDEPDQGTVTLQVFDPAKSDPLRIIVPFTADVDIDGLARALNHVAHEVTPSSYDSAIRPLLNQFECMLSDGWMKPGLSKSDLTAAETERVMAIAEALGANAWELAAEWQQLFDAGIGLSPLLHADKPGGLGPMHLDYFARTDFFELTTAYDQFKIRIFPGNSLGEVVRILDELKQPLDPQWEPRINALCRAPILMETSQGWRAP